VIVKCEDGRATTKKCVCGGIFSMTFKNKTSYYIV